MPVACSRALQGLRLHTNEVLDRLQSGQPLVPQQHLPFQRGAVERTRGEYGHVCHRDRGPYGGPGSRKAASFSLFFRA